MSNLKRQFTKSEKLEIVSQSLEAGQTVQELAKQYGIHPQSIYRWRSEYARYEAAAFPGQGNKTLSESERQIAELEKQLKESQLECEILKKAVGIFSKTDRKYSNL